ncbi:MAG TPA: RdgB/HAM1 family non-canonical purine NTP pyrophosphatase [Gemmatimonadaceae bacterium]
MTAGPWVLATRNAGKLRELRPLFAEAGVSVVDLVEAGIAESPDEEALECHSTFEANSLAKARWFAARSGGLPVIADDSGLEVAALGGAPGVRSKRWSGRTDVSGAALDAANNALLLERLRGEADRRARFVCAAAWCDGARELVVRGETPGVIVQEGEARGAHGFGYDPLFWSDELGATLAEATVAEKQAVSHRGRAFAELLLRLRQLTAHQ